MDNISINNNLPPSIFRNSSSLCVSDLSEKASEAVLFDKLSVHGILLAIRVCRDRATHRSLGYAYIRFQNPNCAEKCMKELQLSMIFGQKIHINWIQPLAEDRNHIFINNLESSINTRMIYNTFSTFGKILKCKVPMNLDKSSKGFAFICFEQTASAAKAVETMKGMTLGDLDQVIFVGKIIATSAEDENDWLNGNCTDIDGQPLLVLLDESKSGSDSSNNFDYTWTKARVYVNYEEEKNEEIIQEYLTFIQASPDYF